MAWENSNRADRLPKDWRRTRARILRRDRRTCQLTGPDCIGTATEVDHIQAGDDHDPANLQAVCTRCHASKSGHEGGTASTQARAARPRLRPAESHPGLL
ncbi:HNH endonuclease [Spirillospora sp. NBC_01491]|uniref:HNH endonuclease n=1 Tax=Spirillospora sp. NBC_01491 TaxID=2976007 RepID=UPI002E33F44A|nr:HNH endonuclease signature motif containing protein [Spirillospora sp. NBC_01491]